MEVLAVLFLMIELAFCGNDSALNTACGPFKDRSEVRGTRELLA